MWSEAAWLWFYLPRGGVQALAQKLPLSALRDRLPTAVSERLRFGLYPARVSDPPQLACARSYPPWGEPPAFDPQRADASGTAPRVSILIVTHGNLALTQLCLASVQRAAGPTPFEVIIVDNASADGTQAYLEGVAASRRFPVRVVANQDNRGFAAANNQAGPQFGLELHGVKHQTVYDRVGGGMLTSKLNEEDVPIAVTFALLRQDGKFLIAADYPAGK